MSRYVPVNRAITCEECNGTGLIEGELCFACMGEGEYNPILEDEAYVSESERLKARPRKRHKTYEPGTRGKKPKFGRPAIFSNELCKRYSVSLPETIYKWCKEQGDKEGTNVSGVIRNALEDYQEKNS